MEYKFNYWGKEYCVRQGHLDAVHHVKYVLTLALHLHAYALAEVAKFLCHNRKLFLHLCHIDNHHHVEIFLNDGLRDVKNVDFVIGQIATNFGNDSNGVFANYCYNCFIYIPIMFIPVVCY